MHPPRRRSLRARCTLIAVLAFTGLSAGCVSVDLASLLSGDDDWLEFSDDSCNDHSRHHAAAPAAPAAPSGPPVAFPPNTR